MAAVRPLGFGWRVLGGLYHYAKFWYNRNTSFDNERFNI